MLHRADGSDYEELLKGQLDKARAEYEIAY
jgi:hypothetical protein